MFSKEVIPATKKKTVDALKVDFEDRLNICSKCDRSTKIVQGFPTFCKECGCAIQAKAFFEHLHCPLKKW